MTGILTAPDLGFLYRTDQGLIRRETWWLGTLFIVIPLLVMSGIWVAIESNADPDSSSHPAVIATLVTYIYLFIYAFAILLGTICLYNLSAKRWRDRGRPAWFAALFPLAAFFALTLTWYQPIAGEDVYTWEVLTLDAIFAVVAVWSITELGFLPSRAK